MTYSIRRIAMTPPNNLMAVLMAGTNNRRIKPPLSGRRTYSTANEGGIQFIMLRSDAIYLMQIKGRFN